ncbi:cysteine proteinase inhibitor 5-like [Cynara cardunculus var. scolymus]|uniref:cysteine proteinase inhibitor 5-like n=1 Tax=Cynara cardunculus var. scolymus TaxID=59895 RepID=UPI000D627F85|nr:cysteine proteinase inhibitor 5-like [Cynara cardunculus var. scolymus]
MRNLLITILIFFLPFIFCNSSQAARSGALVGGWTKITDVNDPTVVDIGKFAVDQHNKQDQASLKFSTVVNGEKQVVAGMNYNLTITAADGTVDKNYVAVVWDKPWVKNSRRLTSFRGPI